MHLCGCGRLCIARNGIGIQGLTHIKQVLDHLDTYPALGGGLFIYFLGLLVW